MRPQACLLSRRTIKINQGTVDCPFPPLADVELINGRASAAHQTLHFQPSQATFCAILRVPSNDESYQFVCIGHDGCRIQPVRIAKRLNDCGVKLYAVRSQRDPQLIEAKVRRNLDQKSHRVNLAPKIPPDGIKP